MSLGLKRGASSVMKTAGIMLVIVSIITYFIKDIKRLEEMDN